MRRNYYLPPPPPPGPCSGRPWPYRPIILPRRSLTQKRLIYSATSASNMTPLWIFELYVLTSIVRDACGAVAGPVCAEPKRAAGAYCLDGASLCGCARYTPSLHLIKPHDRNLEFPFFSPPLLKLPAFLLRSSFCLPPACSRLPSAKCFNVMQVFECKFQIFLRNAFLLAPRMR